VLKVGDAFGVDSSSDEVSKALQAELQSRLRKAGVDVTVHHRDAGLNEDDAHRH